MPNYYKKRDYLFLEVKDSEGNVIVPGHEMLLLGTGHFLKDVVKHTHCMAAFSADLHVHLERKKYWTRLTHSQIEEMIKSGTTIGHTTFCITLPENQPHSTVPLAMGADITFQSDL